jgi:hypothetical protein
VSKPPDRSRARLWFALGLGAALVAVVVVVVIASGDGDSEDEVAAAPATCLKSWNGDPVAREAGRHVLTFHRYEEAQVGYLAPTEGVDAAIDADPAAGLCTAIFPSNRLDPEPEYAGFVLTGGRWASLSEALPEARLAELQAVAVDSPNATISDEGELSATGAAG